MSLPPSNQTAIEAQVPVADVVGHADSADPPARPREGGLSRILLWSFLAVAIASLAANVLLWQKLSGIQEQLARQSADSGARSIEAHTLAKQAQEQSRDTAARQAVAESRLSEVALQRTQLEDLIQSLSRSRDENLLVDIESALRLAQQQAQLTGSAEPLLAELRTADQRLARAAQPRLARVRAALARDMERVRTSSTTDVPGLLAKIDELTRQVDELPLANSVGGGRPAVAAPRTATPREAAWWQRLLNDVQDEARALVRVSRIDQPDAVLLAPDQAFFLRENLKLKLVNARLGLLSRQTQSARADVSAAAAALNKYFDPSARKTQAAAGLMQQVQAQLRNVEVPRIDETLAVLTTTSAGR